MTSIIRTTNHPTAPDLVQVHIPIELNDKIRMLEPARWSPPDKAYLLHRNDWPALESFAHHVGAYIHDQRTNPIANQIHIPQECRHCGQPGRANHPPTYCPACGNLWDPVGPPVDGIAGVVRTPCPSCGHKQSGRFGYCTRCGQSMTVRPATTAPALANVREHLDEPLPLRAAIDEVNDHLTEERP
jgi:hypothetical protein